jgi:RNA polymerase sigma factor (sigma-70 family)
MNEDAKMLHRYATEHSEAAFGEFTRRHVDLVYSAALRLVYGDAASAEDVTQQVFAEVARNAARLARHPALVGWLYTATRLLALRMSRTEQRRKRREQEAHMMNELLHEEPSASDWEQVRPVIDEAMHDLDDKDRHAVLLRFFQNKSLAEVGSVLGLSENAARMRVERALDKLRGKMARRGITTTAVGLAALVSANAVQAAPLGFAATLSGAAISASAVHASTLIATTGTLTMTTIQKTIVVAALATAVGTGLFTVQRTSSLNAQMRALQQQQAPLTEQVRRLGQEREEAAQRIAALIDENAQLKSGRKDSELLRLRGEVGTLRQKVSSNASSSPQPSGGLAKMMSDPAMKEYMRKAMMEKMHLLYADLIKELKLTPEQTEQFLQVLSDSGTKSLAKLMGTPQGASDAGAPTDVASQLQAVLGDAGCARFKEFSEEMPARATLTLLNAQLGAVPLSDEQNANLIKVIKAEPHDLTQGILGSPDKAFLGSQADIDGFLQQVAQSNQRILQQAETFLSPTQVAALDGVLAKAIDARKLQGEAFFQKK